MKKVNREQKITMNEESKQKVKISLNEERKHKVKDYIE